MFYFNKTTLHSKDERSSGCIRELNFTRVNDSFQVQLHYYDFTCYLYCSYFASLVCLQLYSLPCFFISNNVQLLFYYFLLFFFNCTSQLSRDLKSQVPSYTLIASYSKTVTRFYITTCYFLFATHFHPQLHCVTNSTLLHF